MKSSRLSRPLRLIAAFGGAVAMLIAGTTTFFALQREKDNRTRVAQSQSIIETAAATLSAAQDAETGQRGYLVTGDTAYLAPYTEARGLLGADTLALLGLTQADPSQRLRVERLDQLIVRKLQELEKTIAMRRSGSMRAMEDVVRSGRGKAIMDSIRTTVAAIGSEERRVLDERLMAADRAARATVYVLILGTFGAIVCALVLNVILSGSARDLERANDRLATQIGKVEAANAAKSDFLAAVSHELRTPLNAIDGYTELLLLGVRGELTDAQRADIERIKKSSRHLLSLINQVLNLAKVESGQVDLDLALVPLMWVLQEVDVLIRPQMDAKQITFTITECSPAQRVYADPDRLKQVLLNLVANAQKFTDPGGRVTISCRPNDDGSVEIDVTDTGRGIPREKLSEIFEPFTQLNRLQTPDSHRGIGLGLSISRTLAQAMGGNLTVESEAGKGSTFRVTLPASRHD